MTEYPTIGPGSRWSRKSILCYTHTHSTRAASIARLAFQILSFLPFPYQHNHDTTSLPPAMGLFKSLTKKSRSRNKESNQQQEPAVASSVPKLEPLTLKLDFESPSAAPSAAIANSAPHLSVKPTNSTVNISSASAQQAAGSGLFDDIFSELDTAKVNKRGMYCRYM